MRVRMTKELQSVFRGKGDRSSTDLLKNYKIRMSDEVNKTILNRIDIDDPIVSTDGYRYLDFEYGPKTKIMSTLEVDALTVYFTFGCIADFETKYKNRVIAIRQRTFEELHLIMMENKDMCDYIDFKTGEIYQERKGGHKRVQIFTNTIGARQFLGKQPTYDYSLIKKLNNDASYEVIGTGPLDIFINQSEIYDMYTDGRHLFVGDEATDALLVPAALFTPYSYRMEAVQMHPIGGDVTPPIIESVGVEGNVCTN